MLKERIKSCFLGKYLISVLHCVESRFVPILIPDEIAVKRFFKKTAGYELDLNNPKTFSEKTNWYKLNARWPLMQKCADKYAVRGYVAEKGFADNLNEVYGVYSKVKDIHLEELPDQFVLKATHGSHMNIIVRNKAEINWKQAKLLMNTWLHQDIYWSGREWVYKDIPRRIIAEEYLEDATGELRDFKFFCFNGNPTCVQYDGERYTGNHFRNYYDMDMRLLPVKHTYPKRELVQPICTRDNFEEMKQIALSLSKPFQFSRIDLYLVQNKVYFGEITFFHEGGRIGFEPKEFDEYLGEQWKLRHDEPN